MINRLFLVLFSLVSLCVYSQALKSSDNVSIYQEVDILKHRNKEFRLSANIRIEEYNGNEFSTLWVTVIRENDERGFFSNDIGNDPITGVWKTFSVSGKIDSDAKILAFGLYCENNGKFFFDDFKFEVQSNGGKWEPVPLKNPDFEQVPQNESIVWGNSAINSIRQFEAAFVTENASSGQYSLLIEGKGIYGQNDNLGGYVDVNGVRIYHEIYGKGDPLILLHGAGQSIAAFTEQIDFFAENYRVIAVDSRGRGRSTDDEQELTYNMQADDMKMFMENINVESSHIIGWSDGGIIGLLMAKKYPQKVKKLVAMGANINPEGIYPARLQQHKEKLEVLKKENNPENNFYIKLYKQLINYPKLDFKDLKTIVAPTLIMAGDHDVIQDSHTLKMFQAIPNSNLAILPGETHWFPSSNPKLFNEIVLNFLSKEFKKPERY